MGFFRKMSSALRRYSSIQAGSPFIFDISRTMSALRPLRALKT